MNADALSTYDYELPPELIAQHPPAERDAARLMVVDRSTGDVAHRGVRDLPALIEPGDCLVLNDTRVIPARLIGEREQTGGKWEGLYLGSDAAGNWRLIGQTRGRLRDGEFLVIRSAPEKNQAEHFQLKLLSRDGDGVWTAKLDDENADTLTLLEKFGTVPLPPYIEREQTEAGDVTRYQTVYARQPGAVAAPTAGLHFTPELLDDLRSRGVRTAFVTLHVGIGTFRPIGVEDLSRHQMHAEWCRLSEETATTLNVTRRDGGRVIAVGTTAVRTLESAVGESGFVAWEGETRMFIRPPYRFRAVDGLLTNFHLPKSSLLVLVGAFLGLAETIAVYEAAVRERYRFFSYGDAMLIL